MKNIFKLKTITLILILGIVQTPILMNAQNFWEKVDLPECGYINDFLTDKDLNQYIATGTGLFVEKAGSSAYELIEHEYGFSKLFVWHDTVFASLATELYTINPDALSYTEYGEIPWGVMSVYVTKNNSVLFGTSTHIIKSDNLKQPWDSVSEYDDMGNVFDFAEDQNGNLYVCSINYFGGICGVFQSLDGGNTWKNIGLNEHSVTSLAVTKDNHLLAGSLRDMNGFGGVYKYLGDSANWENILYGSIAATSIVVDTNNVIYVGNDDNNGGDTIWIRRSIDEGASWENISSGTQDKVTKLYLGADNYLYVNNTHWWAGNYYGGLYRSIEPVYVGINETYKEKDERLFIYPCPASSQIEASFNKPETGKVTILNSSGITIDNYKIFSKSSISLNILTYKPGIYFAVFTDNNGKIQTTKFIKQ